MGEVEYAPGEPKGTPWHPHRGFETVTYMIDGEMAHQDSNGGGGLITNGDTQWMTAGAGILHIETPPEALVVSGGLFHGFQLWVNLPRDEVGTAALPGHPRRQGRAAHLARRRRPAAPDRRRLGRARAGPGSTYTPITLVHATLAAGCGVDAALEPGLQRAGLRARRRRHRRRRGHRPLRAGQLAVLGAGDTVPSRPTRARTPQPRARRAGPRRPTDPRACRALRPVRHEHRGRAGPGLRGLPGRHASAPSPPSTDPSPSPRRRPRKRDRRLLRMAPAACGVAIRPAKYAGQRSRYGAEGSRGRGPGGRDGLAAAVPGDRTP